jgi:NAD(P)-dependent dehydrogenase (short-subunit alcohol dehydrogenase family)
LSVPKRKEGWAIADRYAGIEDAQLVVVNVRAEDDRAAAEELAADVKRVREDEALFADIIGHRGTRVPVTVVVADVTAPAAVDFKKALARIRRAVRLATA